MIIALIIAGMAASALFEAAGSGLHATRTASMYDQAIVRAKSRLAAATHGTRLAPATGAAMTAAAFGGDCAWRPSRPRHCVRSAWRASRRRVLPVVLYGVSVWVGWNDGGTERDRCGWIPSRSADEGAVAAGFTLLEILVALAVFGFLLVGLSQTVRFGLTAWRQHARLSDGKTDLEAVDRTLRSIIENLAPGEDAGPAGDRRFGRQLDRRDPLARAGFRADANAASRPDWPSPASRLVLRWRPYHHGDAVAAAAAAAGDGVDRRCRPPAGFAYWRPSGVWVVRLDRTRPAVADPVPPDVRRRAPHAMARHRRRPVVVAAMNRPSAAASRC